MGKLEGINADDFELWKLYPGHYVYGDSSEVICLTEADITDYREGRKEFSAIPFDDKWADKLGVKLSCDYGEKFYVHFIQNFLRVNRIQSQ